MRHYIISSKKKLFIIIQMVLLLLISSNWIIYYSKLKYPVKWEGEIVQLKLDLITRFANYPVITKNEIDISSYDLRNYYYEILYYQEIIVQDEKNFIISPIKLVEVNKVKTINAQLNNEKIDLYVNKSREIKGVKSYIGENDTWIYNMGELKNYYYTKSINMTGNYKVNKLLFEMIVSRQLHKTHIVKSPLFFNKEFYCIFINIPLFTIGIFKDNKTQINSEVNINIPFYTINKKYSGWMGWHTSRENVEKSGEALIFQKPIEQELSEYNDVIYITSYFEEKNQPSNFLISFIPDYSIFLFLLSILWSPFILLISKKLKKSTVITIYILLFLELIGINNINVKIENINNLFEFIIILFKLLHPIYLMFIFLYPALFVYVLRKIDDSKIITVKMPIISNRTKKIIFLTLFFSILIISYYIYIQPKVGLYETDIKIHNINMQGNLTNPILNFTGSIINFSNKNITLYKYELILQNITDKDGNKKYNLNLCNVYKDVINIKPNESFNMNTNVLFEFDREIITMEFEIRAYIKEIKTFRLRKLGINIEVI